MSKILFKISIVLFPISSKENSELFFKQSRHIPVKALTTKLKLKALILKFEISTCLTNL